MTPTAQRWIEAALIVLGLLSFWPWILGYEGWWYSCGLLAVMTGLGILAVVRARRVKRAIGQWREPPEM
jgi:hypothetical protein